MRFLYPLKTIEILMTEKERKIFVKELKYFNHNFGFSTGTMLNIIYKDLKK